MAMTTRDGSVTGRIGRVLGCCVGLLAAWLAVAPFARAAPPAKDFAPLHEGSDFVHCRFKVFGNSGQQCQPPLAENQVICLPCQTSHPGGTSCLEAGTIVSAPIVSQDGSHVLCPLIVESLGGDCGACGAGERMFSDDPIFIGTFAADNRFHDEIGEDETFCLFMVTEVSLKKKDPDEAARRENCAVKPHQNVCLPCPAGGACPVAGLKAAANLDLVAGSNDCPVILISQGGACVACPQKSVLFKAP